jgi:hypothetical protein
MSLFDSFRAGGSSRRVVLLILAATLLGTAVHDAEAQDGFYRTVALSESLVPVGILLGAGVDTPLEAGLVLGSIALHTAPNVVLLVAEANGNARLTRIARLLSSGAGFLTAAAGLGVGVPVLFGAFDSLDLTAYAGSFVAMAIPAVFAAAIDLLPYSLESVPAD